MKENRFSIDFAGQDAVIPYQVDPLDIRGRSVQLGPMLDSILARHDYPEPVSRLVAEAITLTVLLGSALKFDGRFTIQTQTDGAVSMIVTDFQTPGFVRAYARYDDGAVSDMPQLDMAGLLGFGTLAMTIDQGEYMQRYQGIVQLDNTSLEEAARQYFRQSEQIPTEIRLAVGEVLTRQQDGSPAHAWIAGGILAQFLPDSEERTKVRELPGGDGIENVELEDEATGQDEAWTETQLLMNTIEDVELTDASVQPEQLLFRLFNEHGVRVFDSILVGDQCSCSVQKVSNMLAGLTDQERADSVEKGEIRVKCEFCSESYVFDPATFNS